MSNLTIFYAGDCLICMFVNREIPDCVLINFAGGEMMMCIVMPYKQNEGWTDFPMSCQTGPVIEEFKSCITCS